MANIGSEAVRMEMRVTTARNGVRALMDEETANRADLAIISAADDH